MRAATFCTAAALLILPLRLFASQEPPPPPPGEEGMPPPPMDAPPRGPRHGDQGPDAPMRKWIDQLKEQNPQEFERLHKLRDENLEAFREELRSRVRQERIMNALNDHPDIAESFRSLPPQEREKIFRKLTQEDGPPGMMRNRSPELEQLEREIMDMARSCRATTNESERAGQIQDLREKIAEAFDLRARDRAAEISRLEEQLINLKLKFESRKARREEIIDQRLRELTEGRNWDW